VRLLDKSPVKDADLSRFQDRVRDTVNPVLANPLLDGRLLEVDLEPTGATTLVEHKLGRDLVGWFLVDLTSGVLVWRIDTQRHPDKYLELEQSGASAVSVKLYVF
jgi:hypothetical protein